MAKAMISIGRENLSHQLGVMMSEYFDYHLR